MKKYLISTVAVLLVLAVAWIAFGQEQSERAQRRAQRMARIQAATKVIETIQEQAGKLKTALEEGAIFGSIGSRQDLSEEERAKLREEVMKNREEWWKMLAVIEQQFTIPKGRRQRDREHEESIAELQTIQALATTEKAEKTAKRLEELIAKRNKEHEDTMQKLGLEQFGRRR